MDEKELFRLIDYAVGDADLSSREIPSIDLYLDQIISLVENKNRESTDMFRDRVLTKTMINNYSKDDLIAPIKGKKYSKEHVVQMLVIYALKNTLSISAIRRLLQGVYHEPVSFDGDMLTRGYDAFLEVKQKNREDSREICRKMMEENHLDLGDDLQFFTFLMGLASLSADLKNITMALLCDRYPDYEFLRRQEAELEKLRQKSEKEDKDKEKKKKKKAKEDEEETEE